MIVGHLLDAIFEVSLHDTLHSTCVTRGLVNAARTILVRGPNAQLAHSLISYADLAHNNGCVKGAEHINAAIQHMLEELARC